MKGYYFTNATEDQQNEITRERASAVAEDDGIKNTEKYLDEIESGRYGSGAVQVARNVYYGEIE